MPESHTPHGRGDGCSTSEGRCKGAPGEGVHRAESAGIVGGFALRGGWVVVRYRAGRSYVNGASAGGASHARGNDRPRGMSMRGDIGTCAG